MALRRVAVHPNQLVHWAKPRSTELSKWVDMSDLTEDEWWTWHTICGKDVIGHPNDEFYPEVTCRSCLRVFGKAQKVYRDLERRFGDEQADDAHGAGAGEG
jgi:hypothetical protein